MGIFDFNTDVLFDSIFSTSIPSTNEVNGSGLFSVLEDEADTREIDYIKTSISKSISEEIYQQRRILKFVDINA